ncbi:MAG: hypothetical protein ACFE0O_10415 [Opitutales bacterium]
MDNPSDSPLFDSKQNDTWNTVRKSFHTSIMVDTRLSSLAENLDLDPWPIEDDEEVPSKYIDYTLPQLHHLPEFHDNPERIQLLIDILQGTLAFDDPFGDMVEQVESSAAGPEQTVGKTLTKLEIPADYPIQLTNLSPEAKELCFAEDIETVGQFAEFAQGMAEKMVVGGDFKAFLNALIHVDKTTIARYLPFRPRHTGLHLPEAFGMMVSNLSPEEIEGLAVKYGRKPADPNQPQKLSMEKLDKLEARLRSEIGPILVWFGEERKALSDSLAAGESVERTFMVLDDPDRERIALNIMKQIFTKKDDGSKKGGDEKGLLGKLAGLFGKK